MSDPSGEMMGEHIALREFRKYRDKAKEFAKDPKGHFIRNEGSLMWFVNWMDDATASFWFVPIVMVLVGPTGVWTTVGDAKMSLVIFIAALVLYVMAVGSRLVSYERDGFTWMRATLDTAVSALLFVPHLYFGVMQQQLEFVPNGLDDVYVAVVDVVGFIFTANFLKLIFRKDKPKPVPKQKELVLKKTDEKLPPT